MIRFLLFLCSLFLLVACSSRKEASLADPSLIVLDLSGDFPSRKVDVHDIADVEYIALETNENSLLTNTCSNYFMSDDYIVTSDFRGGNIFFFNRSGKHLWTINRRGQGAEEYTTATLVVDFDAQECFVLDVSTYKIFVYDFKGVYKRLLPAPSKQLRFWFYNYDKNFLLAYNQYFDYATQKHEDEHPYYLVSKKDGTMHPLNLTLKDRIGPSVHSELIRFEGGATLDRTILRIEPVVVNGTDVLIADFTLDTLYHSSNGKLTPIALRTPSVRATTPPMVLNPLIYTDSLLCFETIPFYYNPSNPQEPHQKSRKLACDRKTGKIEEIEFFNSDFLSRGRNNLSMISVNRGGALKNICVYGAYPDLLLERYEAGQLKGKLKEVASKLKIDDNKVLILCKFK